jgi:hypothetical protein
LPLITPQQIDLFCVRHLADTVCLEADHIGGAARIFDLSASYALLSALVCDTPLDELTCTTTQRRRPGRAVPDPRRCSRFCANLVREPLARRSEPRSSGPAIPARMAWLRAAHSARPAGRRKGYGDPGEAGSRDEAESLRPGRSSKGKGRGVRTLVRWLVVIVAVVTGHGEPGADLAGFGVAGSGVVGEGLLPVLPSLK